MKGIIEMTRRKRKRLVKKCLRVVIKGIWNLMIMTVMSAVIIGVSYLIEVVPMFL